MQGGETVGVLGWLMPHLCLHVKNITCGWIKFLHLMFIGPFIIAIVDEERTTWCHLLFYFTYYVLNMFRTLIYPSSGASFCRLKPAKRTPPKTARTKSSNTQRTENKTTDVVIHQHSRKLLKMDILMSETWWGHNKWNRIASDIKLVFH